MTTPESPGGSDMSVLHGPKQIQFSCYGPPNQYFFFASAITVETSLSRLSALKEPPLSQELHDDLEHQHIGGDDG